MTSFSYDSTGQDKPDMMEYPTLIVYLCAFANVETTSFASYCLQKGGTTGSRTTQDNKHLAAFHQAFEVPKNLNLSFPPAGYLIEQACYL